MDYPTLRIVHLTGLALTFMGLAGVLALKFKGENTFKQRWIFHVAHGMGLLVILASGIGLGLKLGLVHPAPFWIIAKFGVWLLAGSAMILALRFSRFAGIILIYFTALVLAAAWLAIYKPS
jgi:uncharacterized membrane protein SirB2